MDRLDALRAFVHAAETGSFAAAGRLLGLSRDQVSKMVVALEAMLGKRLFARSTRRVDLTEPGVLYLERARRALAELETGERLLRDVDGRPSGIIKVHAPLSWSVTVLASLCSQFRSRFPEMRIEITVDDAVRHPVPVDVDVTIRIAERFIGTAAVERLGVVRRTFYAAPTYLDRRGMPATLEEVTTHEIVSYANLEAGAHWLLHRKGETRRVDIFGSVSSNAGLVVREALLAGAGIGPLPDFLARGLVENGRLVPVLEGWELAPLTILALTNPRQRDASGIDAYLAFLRQALSSSD